MRGAISDLKYLIKVDTIVSSSLPFSPSSLKNLLKLTSFIFVLSARAEAKLVLPDPFGPIIQDI